MRLQRVQYAIAAGLMLLLSSTTFVRAQSGRGFTPATIVYDEGGPVQVTGTLTYTNARFFLFNEPEPAIILEDQAGFVDRNYTYQIPLESEILAHITSDFDVPPVTYSLSLPAEPLGGLRDVDHNGHDDTGVQVFAVAYWDNLFDGPYLEQRDLMFGGWSNAYASTRSGTEKGTYAEIVGGKYIVYSPDAEQGFPADFGADEKLFTNDDPIVGLPQGYTVVNMDTHPFTFSREKHAVLDLNEPKYSALVDFSKDTYTGAFEAVIAKMREEYAFTDEKQIDWDAELTKFRPEFVEADKVHDEDAYKRAFRDFVLSIPDGHLSMPVVMKDYGENYGGGLGIALTELDDGRVLVSYRSYSGAAYEAGFQVGTEIIAINGVPIHEAIDKTVPYIGPYSSDIARHLAQLAFVTRFPIGAKVVIEYKNPYDTIPSITRLTADYEVDSFRESFGVSDDDDTKLPIDYSILSGGYGLVNFNRFDDDEVLTVKLWERMIKTMISKDAPAIIIDMRHNRGGSGRLASMLSTYFYDASLHVASTDMADTQRGDYYQPSRSFLTRILPPESMRYTGKVVLLIGPNCYSACELFSYNLKQSKRATAVGQYPTAGLGGGITSTSMLAMPGDFIFQFPTAKYADPTTHEIIVEGTGVAPDIKVPIDEDSIVESGYDAYGDDDTDPVLDAAIDYLYKVQYNNADDSDS